MDLKAAAALSVAGVLLTGTAAAAVNAQVLNVSSAIPVGNATSVVPSETASAEPTPTTTIVVTETKSPKPTPSAKSGSGSSSGARSWSSTAPRGNTSGADSTGRSARHNNPVATTSTRARTDDSGKNGSTPTASPVATSSSGAGSVPGADDSSSNTAIDD